MNDASVIDAHAKIFEMSEKKTREKLLYQDVMKWKGRTERRLKTLEEDDTEESGRFRSQGWSVIYHRRRRQTLGI